MSNHSEFDNAVSRSYDRGRKAGEAHPFESVRDGSAAISSEDEWPSSRASADGAGREEVRGTYSAP